jgi:hypothetical protein
LSQHGDDNYAGSATNPGDDDAVTTLPEMIPLRALSPVRLRDLPPHGRDETTTTLGVGSYDDAVVEDVRRMQLRRDGPPVAVERWKRVSGRVEEIAQGSSGERNV